ncbi:hypothetical protein Cme02nite_56080 [Catellatospora methionotrophica]|uniref:Uncharacterized protein n=1 Tax=Catellatospora methionotrophica TaxID=121620 RepID=A0A8J3PJC2_9ACTN|nr:hypothetical protein [Catellatospora methionotrophica]GIG17276.1 hypothetical protein Cme02nite_56080 [Catellatospora methionotrophica]
MTDRLWRAQLTLVWAFGLAVCAFLCALLIGGVHGGNGTSVYAMVYAPLHEGTSIRGSLANPFGVLTLLGMVVAWLSPLAAVLLAWRGRRALRGEGEQSLRDRIEAGTIAAYVIAALYLTPVGWTLIYGLTRWTAMNIWGEGPNAANLG